MQGGRNMPLRLWRRGVEHVCDGLRGKIYGAVKFGGDCQGKRYAYGTRNKSS
jgi:hypothetical protein